jgi:hypothetical protein
MLLVIVWLAAAWFMLFTAPQGLSPLPSQSDQLQ